MKKTIIKCLYLAVVFCVALVLSGSLLNQGNTDMTMEMGAATYPVVHMKIAGMEVNPLHGYKEAMQCSFQRDSITPLGKGRRIGFVIDKYGQEIGKLTFEVRSIDGQRLVESTEIIGYMETEDTISGEFTVKDLIEADTEYMLVLLLENGWGQTIRYYTRIIQTENYYEKEKLDYVLDFHKRTFDKDAAMELTKYLESNADGDNTTFGKVDIHSSFQQVTWGDLEVNVLTEPEVTIKELGEQTGSLELDYAVSLGGSSAGGLFMVKEFYRIRYTADRIYLLDYERTMRQVFDEGGRVFASNKIYMGILPEGEVGLKESEGGNFFAFSDGNRLFCYDVAENKLSRLFSFYDGDYTDKRATWPKHGIRILNVDEAGNVQFIVYGYMNRGRHEGEVGIAVYQFSNLMNTVEELVYIPSKSTYEILRAELAELAYINKADIFFFMHDGAIFAVNLAERSYEVMVAGLEGGSYKVSDSNRMIVWQMDGGPYTSRKLILMNLSTKERQEIPAGNEEYIAPLGFMGEDLIYGLARSQDVVRDKTGSILFPMYCVRIQSENGEILKTYGEEGLYVTGSEIEGNQINLYRVRRSEEDGGYAAAENDQIVNTKIEPEGSNVVEVVAVDKYEKVTQIAVKSTVDEKKYKLLTPREVLFEGGREIVLKTEEEDGSRYFVYGKNGVEGIFTDEGDAVNMAYEQSGIVIDEQGSYVWARGNRSLKNQIMAIKGAAITEEKNSLAVCLDIMLQYEGIMRNTEYMLNQGDTIRDVLEENLEEARVLDLTGCSLDAVLYYVNKDIPVLASFDDGNAVLIIGFNELNTVLMDPLTGGTPFKMGMNDSTRLFEENGNRFITYQRKR